MALNMLAILLIPCLLLVIVLSFITLNRYISYKERVALAELGVNLEDWHRETQARRGSRGVLWGGVITAMSGLALLLGLSTIGFGAWLLGGLVPLFVGLGMVLLYFIASGPAPEKQHEAPPDATESGNPAPPQGTSPLEEGEPPGADAPVTDER